MGSHRTAAVRCPGGHEVLASGDETDTRLRHPLGTVRWRYRGGTLREFRRHPAAVPADDQCGADHSTLRRSENVPAEAAPDDVAVPGLASGPRSRVDADSPGAGCWRARVVAPAS